MSGSANKVDTARLLSAKFSPNVSELPTARSTTLPAGHSGIAVPPNQMVKTLGHMRVCDAPNRWPAPPNKAGMRTVLGYKGLEGIGVNVLDRHN
ncbi:hypothetical protein E4U55_007523 [Claviceps digitariae]|nr:hypothetical protein E4U55_007523 [Claviceps digitariae]